MTKSRRTVQEKYASATASGNTTDSAGRSQLDIVRAFALVGGLGSLLVRVKIGLDASSHPQLVSQWNDRVTLMADRNHWPTCVKPEKVAVDVLRYWLKNVCGYCGGRGAFKHATQPTLTADICPHCDGSGILPPQFSPEYRRYALDALAELEEIDRVTGIRASLLLKDRN